MLGSDLAAILLVEALKDEVRGTQAAEAWLVAELLARSIRHHCPAGWRSEKSHDFERAHAIAATTSSLRDLGPDWPRRLMSIGAELMHRRIEDGWLPRDAEDTHLADAVRLSGLP